MADVFISYARSTAKIARAAADALAKEGLSVWFDQDLPAGRAYADVISERLDEAKAVLVLWSKEAVASHWVRSEADRARARGTLIQASVDGSAPPMPFDQIQCADLARWRGNANAPVWRKLCADIAELVHGSGAAAQPPAAGSGGLDRRHVLAGAGTLAAAGAGLYFLSRPRPYQPPPEAEVLRQKAIAIMQDGRWSEQSQAIIYLKEATRLAPDFASAWGGLALVHALRKFQVPLAARAGEEARCRSAAQTALKLDSREPLSHCALLALTPSYRDWQNIARRAQALVGRIAPIPLVFHGVGDLLLDVGRSSEALRIYNQIDRKQFFIPLSERTIVQALWNAGEMQLAEERLDEAVGRWPQHYAVWNQRAEFLTHTGHAREAVRMIEDESTHPLAYPADQLQAALVTARAFAGMVSPQDAIRTNLDVLKAGSPDVAAYLNRKKSFGQQAALRIAALGDPDLAFALLDGYYFGEGPWAGIAPAAGDMDRTTFILFEPPMSGLWRDPRFAVLTERIGLDAYWRQSGSTPDFRRS